MKKQILSGTLIILILASLASCSLSTTETTSTSSGTTVSSDTADSNSDTSSEDVGPENGQAMPPPGSGQSNANVSINASTTGLSVNSGTESKSGNTYTSTGDDESAVVVSSGAILTLTNATVTKSGTASNNENSEFYGLNSGVIAKDASTLTITDSTITTSGKEANAVFSTSKSTVNLKNVTIKTTAESGARGLDATYGATINAEKVSVSTVGIHSAAAATDRGEGNVNISNSTLETSGADSPAIYSTGDFKVTNTTGTANEAEAVVIEGQNSVTLTNSILTGFKNWGVLIYQSFSGDAEGTGGNFTMEGGSLTAKDGPLFFSTNTVGYINLKNVTLSQSSGVFLKAAATTRWGTSGSNGATVTVNADTQKIEGSIVADSISSVIFNLKNNSTFTGAIDAENTAKSADVSIDSTSIWSVTADSHVNTIDAQISGTNVLNISGNGHNVYYSSSANSALGGKTYTLVGGGSLIPE